MSPYLYDLIQTVTGANLGRKRMLEEWVPQNTKSILEIGAGTGTNCEYLPCINYFGIEPDKKRCRYAARKHVSGIFYNIPVEEFVDSYLHGIDLCLCVTVLHHLDDVAILHLVKTLKSKNVPILAIEPCWDECGWGINFLLKLMDPGKHIRWATSYTYLVTRYMEVLQTDVHKGCYTVLAK